MDAEKTDMRSPLIIARDLRDVKEGSQTDRLSQKI